MSAADERFADMIEARAHAILAGRTFELPEDEEASCSRCGAVLSYLGDHCIDCDRETGGWLPDPLEST